MSGYEKIISHMAQGFGFKGKVHLGLPDDGPLCGNQSAEMWIAADDSEVARYGYCKRCAKLGFLTDPTATADAQEGQREQ